MREILFRGKRIPDGKWVEGYYAKHEKLNKFGILPAEYPRVSFIIGVYEESIGQYTGLNDENEKKIFEGDIIANEDSSVKWIVKYFCNRFFGISEKDFYISEDLYDLVVEGVYIIGNIHDNPELFTQKVE